MKLTNPKQDGHGYCLLRLPFAILNTFHFEWIGSCIFLPIKANYSATYSSYVGVQWKRVGVWTEKRWNRHYSVGRHRIISAIGGKEYCPLIFNGFLVRSLLCILWFDRPALAQLLSIVTFWGIGKLTFIKPWAKWLSGLDSWLLSQWWGFFLQIEKI